MTLFLLDTDVISSTSPFSGRLEEVQRFLDLHWHQSFLSTLTVGELWFGVARLDLRGATRKSSRLRRWVADVEHSYAERILPADLMIGRRTGELLARAGAAGQQPNFVDACLAATAYERGFTVVTFNARHFDAFGVSHRTPLPKDAP